MKKLICLLLLLTSTFYSIKAQTQSYPDLKQNAIKFNLLSPIFNTINIAYQRLLGPERSIQIGLGYTDFDDFDENNNPVAQTDFNIKGINLCIDYKINMSGYGLNGFYVGPFLRYLNYNKTLNRSSTYKETGKYQSGGLGFLFGKQFLFKNAITIDLFAGPVYHIMISRTESNNNLAQTSRNIYLGEYIEESYIKGYSLRAGFNVGFAF